MYVSLITSLLTVVMKLKDCIAAAMRPKKEADTEPLPDQEPEPEPEPELATASLAPQDERQEGLEQDAVQLQGGTRDIIDGSNIQTAVQP